MLHDDRDKRTLCMWICFNDDATSRNQKKEVLKTKCKGWELCRVFEVSWEILTEMFLILLPLKKVN